MLGIETNNLLVLNVRGNIMTVFVLIPLRKVIQIMIVKVRKMIKRLILVIKKRKVEDETEKDDKNFLNDGIGTLNLCQQNSLLLETVQARVETPDGKRSNLLRTLFHSGLQICFISPNTKRLLNIGVKGSNKYSIKPFANNEIKKELENVDIVFNTFNHEKVLINKLVSDICLPINSQEIHLCKQNYKHLSN